MDVESTVKVPEDMESNLSLKSPPSKGLSELILSGGADGCKDGDDGLDRPFTFPSENKLVKPDTLGRAFIVLLSRKALDPASAVGDDIIAVAGIDLETLRRDCMAPDALVRSVAETRGRNNAEGVFAEAASSIRR